MRLRAALLWTALAIVTAAWLCRLASLSVPALDATARHAAEALYLAELDAQRSAPTSLAAAPPTIESIASAVHRRTTRLLVWIGLGLGLCLAAALQPHARRLIVLASAAVFLAGWIGLDAYRHVGLLHGFDLKMRLVGADPLRLTQFLVLDGLLPALVATVALALLIAHWRADIPAEKSAAHANPLA